MNKYRYVRDHAKKITKTWNQACSRCGYDKHVQTCHLRKISDFPDSAILAEINDENNLKLLCPNCHWEFDHGLLRPEELGTVRIELTT